MDTPPTPTAIFAASDVLLNANPVTPASKFIPFSEYAFATFHAPFGSAAEKVTVTRPDSSTSVCEIPVQLARFSGSSSTAPVHVAVAGTTKTTPAPARPSTAVAPSAPPYVTSGVPEVPRTVRAAAFTRTPSARESVAAAATDTEPRKSVPASDVSASVPTSTSNAPLKDEAFTSVTVFAPTFRRTPTPAILEKSTVWSAPSPPTTSVLPEVAREKNAVAAAFMS